MSIKSNIFNHKPYLQEKYHYRNIGLRWLKNSQWIDCVMTQILPIKSDSFSNKCLIQ